MRRILFVIDGPRDGVTVPRLVERILGDKVEETVRPWARLHKASGYGRKLRYAIRQARAADHNGLAAVVDEDRSGKRRLQEIQAARDQERRDEPSLPVALGLAVPFGEAWLLDDAEAIKTALQLSPSASVPSTQKTGDPKAALEQLLIDSPRAGERPLDVWAAIAKQVNLRRCRHPNKTGFAAFANDVEAELGS